MLPCGVRTFLSRRSGSDHLPARKVLDFASRPKLENACSSLVTCWWIDPHPFWGKLGSVQIRLCLLLLAVGILAPLHGQDVQDGPIKMEPEFCFTFPLAQKGTDVTVKYPVLLNPVTVLKPGMVLRTIYVLSIHTEGPTDLAVAHHGNMAQSFSRSTTDSADADKMPPELAHEIEGYRRTIWQVSNNFVMAMAQYPTDAMHLIYSPTGKTQDMTDSRFSFFDGLLVGLPNGKVTVLAVEKGSKADSAGIKAGDEIVDVGGISTKNDLDTFAANFETAKKTARDNEVSSFPMTIRSESKPDAHVVNIAMPATIKGGLMNGF